MIITDAAIEAAARSTYNALEWGGCAGGGWDNLPPIARTDRLQAAKYALEAAFGVQAGTGDDLDVAARRCCPYCRTMLTEHNVEVWNAGYSIGVRHTRDELVKAWNDGWHEHYLEWERQKNDPEHAISKTNPYAGAS